MLPTFIGIGAQRSGTTWMYQQLKNHPQIWLTPIKEIHYFDTRHLSIFANKNYGRQLLRRSRMLINLNLTVLRDLPWSLRYFLGKRNNNWYVSLFQPKPGQVAGEITPAYMRLEEDIVKEIHKLNPALKVIFLIRNPIERTWSSAIKYLARDRKRPVSNIPETDFMLFFENEMCQLQGNYVRTLQIWERIFESHQIHIDFMDEIQQNPRDVLRRLYDFLEVSSDERFIPANLNNKINSTDKYKTEIPENLKIHLTHYYLPQLKILSERFGGHATVWLQQAGQFAKEKTEVHKVEVK